MGLHRAKRAAEQALDGEARAPEPIAPMDWIEIKNGLVTVTSLEKDALHIYAGIGVQLVAAPWFRRRLASAWPLLLVFVAVLANEWYDLAYETWPPAERTRQWLESAKDILNTLAVPFLIYLLARRRPPPVRDLPPEG